MIFLAYFALFLLFVVAATLDARFARPVAVTRTTPDEHARLARIYAARAESYRNRSLQQQQISADDHARFLAGYYEQRAAKMQSLEQQHTRLAAGTPRRPLRDLIANH